MCNQTETMQKVLERLKRLKSEQVYTTCETAPEITKIGMKDLQSGYEFGLEMAIMVLEGEMKLMQAMEVTHEN